MNNFQEYNYRLIIFNTGEVMECDSSRAIAEAVRYVWREYGLNDEMRAELYYKGEHTATFSEHKGHLWRTVPNKCKTALVW